MPVRLVEKKIEVAANTAWVSSQMHLFSPRKVTPAHHYAMALGFLHRDRNFSHLLRQCRDTWLISVVLGKTSAHLNIYLPRNVDAVDWRPMSQPSILERASFFEVSKSKIPQRVSDDRIARIRQTHPELYMVRDLTLNEVATLDNHEQILWCDDNQKLADKHSVR